MRFRAIAWTALTFLMKCGAVLLILITTIDNIDWSIRWLSAPQPEVYPRVVTDAQAYTGLAYGLLGSAWFLLFVVPPLRKLPVRIPMFMSMAVGAQAKLYVLWVTLSTLVNEAHLCLTDTHNASYFCDGLFIFHIPMLIYNIIYFVVMHKTYACTRK